MVNKNKTLITRIIGLALVFALVAMPAYAIRVYVNPSVQTGNYSPDGAYQEGGNMQDVASRLVTKLANRGFETRNSGMNSITWAASDSASWGSDCFVALHTNAAGSGWNSTHGTLAMYPSGSRYNTNSVNFANALVNKCVSKFNAYGRGYNLGTNTDVYYMGFTLAVFNQPAVPTALVEGLFHTNYDDVYSVLLNSGGHDAYAQAVYEAICDYYGWSYGASGATDGPAACCMNSGRVDLVWRGSNNHIYMKTWTSSGGWSGNIDMAMGGVTYDDPGIVSRADGCLEVFHRGTNSQLYHAYNNGGGWSGWESLGGTILSGTSACKRGDNYSMEVVARGSDNGIQKISWNATSGWVWQNLGGYTNDTPAIVSRDINNMEVFARGTDNQLYHKWWTSSGGWSGWYSLGGSITSSPSVVSRDVNHMEVFARGAAGDMVHIYWTNTGGWSPWTSLGGIVGRVGVCSLNSGHMATFHKSTQSRLLQKSWTSTGGWESGWTDLGTYN